MEGTIRTNGFTIDRSAYLKAMWARGLPKALWVLVALILVAMVVLGATGGWESALGAAIGGFGVMPFAIPARYFIARHNVYARSARQAFDDPRTMEFSNSGIHTKTEGGVESQIPWTHVHTVERRGGFMLLLMGKTPCGVVADSAFASTEDREAMLAEFRERGMLTAKPPKNR